MEDSTALGAEIAAKACLEKTLILKQELETLKKLQHDLNNQHSADLE